MTKMEKFMQIIKGIAFFATFAAIGVILAWRF
jgi:hypothetical protein